MEIYNHFVYGETLARRLKAIAHTDDRPRFFTAIEEEQFFTLEDKLSNITGTTLLAIDGSNADFSWQPDNMTEKPQYFFVILQNTNSDRTETIFAAQNSCRLIANQIISSMMNDHDSWKQGLCTLDPDSFIVRGVGPFADNFYGVLVGFNLLNPFTYTLNPDYWL